MSTYQDFFAGLPANPGGSPKGLSYYASIYECAFRASQPQKVELTTGQAQRSRGTWYHYLWQYRPSCPAKGDLTPEQESAVALYEGYAKCWGTPWERYGCVPLAWEQDFAVPEGWITGRADLVVSVQDPRALVPYGVLLEPGDLLFLDLKTSDSIKKPQYYVHGLQGRYYPAMWNAGQGTKVKGILFDEVVEHAELRKTATKKGGSSFNAHWSPAPLDQEAVFTRLKAWVDFSQVLLTRATKNERSCVDSWGQECPLFSLCHTGL